MLKRNVNARNRFLTLGQYEQLLEDSLLHVRAILYAGSYTGRRLGEILNLTWDKADLKNRVICLEAEDTKDKECRSISNL